LADRNELQSIENNPWIKK